MKSSLIRMSTAALALTTLMACNAPRNLPVSPMNQGAAPANFGRLNQQSAGVQNVPGRFIIKYKDGVASASSLQQLGAQTVRPLGQGMHALQMSDMSAASLSTLENDPAVEFVEPVFTMPFPEVIKSADAADDTDRMSAPNDPGFAKQYALKITNALRGWDVTRGDRRVVIGVVDSGVDINHPDLAAKIVGTYNGADGNNDVMDHVGHGTHVAGIASAITNNGVGIAGAAPDCSILAVKVASGSSSYPSTEGIANGIIWAADHGADVINLSLGAGRESRAITAAVQHALRKNVVVLAATGNGSGNIKSWPALTPGVIAVGSTDARDRRSSFSNYGPWVSVVAPGSDIYSTFPANDNLIGQKNYGTISGTSMATPFAAGVAALIRTRYPEMSPAMVKQALESSAEDKGAPGFDDEFGHGRVDIARAMMRAEELSRGGTR